MSVRFIAGAICPQCRAEDRIVVETPESDGDQTLGERAGQQSTARRYCVDCGFSESLPDEVSDSAPPPGVPTSRLLRRRTTPSTPSSVVRIVDPSAGSEPEQGS